MINMEQDPNLSLKNIEDPVTQELINTVIEPCSKTNTDSAEATSMKKIDMKFNCNSDIDGGYGWVIVTASFFNAFIIDGIGSSFGLLLPYMKEKFHASDFVISFASSLFMAFLIMGTVSVQLTNKFGVRLVAIVGGFLACVSFICSAFVTNVFVFILFYGLATGCACGLVFLPSIIIVNAYFHNLRGVANGIISAGSGAGLVVLSPLIKYLLENYTLDSTILILSGILLNMCVFSCLYRPPPSSVKHNRNNSHSSSSNLTLPDTVEHSENFIELNEKLNFEESIIQEEPATENNRQLQHSRVCEKELQNYVQNNLKLDAVTPQAFARNGCHKHVAIDKSEQRSPWKSEYQLRSSTDRPDYSFYSSVYNLPTWYDASDQAITLGKKRGIKNRKRPGSTQHFLTPYEIPVDQGSQLYLAGSISTLRSLQKKHMQSQAHTSQHLRRTSRSISTEPQPSAENNSSNTDQPEVDLLSSGVDSAEKNNNSEDLVPSGCSLAQLLCLPSFHLFYIGASLIQIGYPIASTFLANYAQQLGHSNTALLMSLLGALNICGRCLAGTLASLKVDPFHLNNISLLLVGVSCLLCPIYQEFWTLCLFSSFYGFFLGFFPPLQPLIIVKEFGLSSLATAFGFLTTIKGLASFPGAPLAGWINDETGDYSLSFVFGGAVFFSSGLIHYLMMCVKK